MSRPHVGLLAALLVVASLAFGTGAEAQSALANCKYYTKIQQDFEQGYPYCSQCIEDEPENPEARFYGAWCLAEMGEWDTAWESYAWLIDRAEDKDKKIRKYSKMARQHVSTYFHDHFETGVQHLNVGEASFPDARDEFKITTRINPRRADGYLNLGYTLGQLGDADGAMTAFESAIAAEPDNATAYEYYWDALGKKRAELLTADPKDEEELERIASILKTTLERVLENNPAEDQALLQLGDLAAAAGDMEAAVQHIQAAIEIDPGNIANLFNIAVGLFNAESFEAAEQTFQLVAEEEDDPDSDLWRDAMRLSAFAMKAQNKHQECLDVLLELLEVVPDSADLHYVVHEMYLELGDLAKASEHNQRYEELAAQELEGGSQ